MKRNSIILFSLLLTFTAACSDDAKDNNIITPVEDMGKTDVVVDPTFKDSDSVAGLPQAAREALCAVIIDEVGNPGDTISCTPDIILPSATGCSETVKKYPACATVKDVKTCLEKQLSCNASLADDENCKFLEFDSCGIDPTKNLTDIAQGDKDLLCSQLLEAAGGTGKTIECEDGLPLTVPSQKQCVAQLNEGKDCATVELFQECYDAIYTCGTPNREKCWFLIGGDSQCVPPYEGPDRRPTGFFSFPPVPVSCDSPGTLQRIPFAFSSSDAVPIVSGDRVSSRPVIPNVSIDAQTISVTQPRVVEVSENPCVSAADCSAGFKCATAGDGKFCSRQTGVEFVPGSVKLDYDPGVLEEKKQLVGVLVENTSLLAGRLPTSTGGKFGEDGLKDLTTQLGRATDPGLIRTGALKSFFNNLASVADAKNTLTTLWYFAGDVPARARPMINENDLQDHFTSDLSVGSALIDALPTPIPRPGNLYQSILSMYEKDFALEKYNDYEKFLFVFTDGPNEVYDPVYNYDKVLEDSRILGVHVFIVHLDTPIDPTLMRDLPEYYLGNRACQDDANCGATACGGDANCQNHESCRPVRVYGKNMGDPVTNSAQQFCTPTYNPEGQLGPVDEFADLACRTNGNYIYLSDVASLATYWQNLPTTINGQFSIQAEFSALGEPFLDAPYYRFSSILVGGLGNSALSHRLLAKEGFRPDNRPLLRIGK